MKQRPQARAARIGILGGGQLARMLVLKAHDLGITVSVLSENENDPAAQVCPLWVRGSLKDLKSIETFLSTVEIATFESEFMDAEMLGLASRKTKTPIFPSPKQMGVLQDRLPQKRLLVKHGLSTAQFESVSNEKEARAAFSNLGGAVVFKRRRFGYDGYGTFVVKNEKSLKAFLPEVAKDENGFIAEKLIQFDREIAIVVARTRSGETTALPFVETFQEDSRCLWVKGPLKSNARLKSTAAKIIEFIEAIGYVGVMGVELFESKSGLLVNELAPRVHNSAHYSLDALTTDQFSLHLRAITGMPVEATPRLNAPAFAMLNLL
ncbi:MAG: ATP-grasp domain-containing protein, partial [Bdellovibrionota bacterium]